MFDFEKLNVYKKAISDQETPLAVLGLVSALQENLDSAEISGSAVKEYNFPEDYNEICFVDLNSINPPSSSDN